MHKGSSEHATQITDHPLTRLWNAAMMGMLARLHPGHDTGVQAQLQSISICDF